MNIARHLLVVAGLAVTLPSGLAARDVYFVKTIEQLKITEGELPDPSATVRNFRYWYRYDRMVPYAVLDGKGEVYVTSTQRFPHVRYENARIAVVAPEGADVKGRLFWPRADGEGMNAVRFSISAEDGDIELQKEFLEHKLKNYNYLLSQDIPGSAWFRHRARTTRQQLGLKEDQNRNRRRRFFGSRNNSVEDTYALVSGGRALSENLQLDRVLPTTSDAAANVKLDSVEGITVREFPWEPLIKGLTPKTDPLAAYVPEDQHVLFFPSFRAMIDMADNVDEQSTPILNMAQPRSESARVRERYERQLCLSLGTAARVLGPRLVRSVAVTGADPYLRTGSDLALLFEANNPAALKQLIGAEVTLKSKDHPQAKAIEGKVGGVAYTGARSPDREICSYTASVDEVVIVTNSLAQLERLVDVATGKAPPLGDLDEYTFFRDRYPRDDKNETGLLIISDQTIRRWCGPRWRIATSRRTRALAVMTDMQASMLDDLASGKAEGGRIYSDPFHNAAGKLSLTPQGIQSAEFGTLDFQTPILEMEMEYVTKEEADLYRRWRDGYQRNWSNFFDPIAVRFHADSDSLAADMTVMPLITGSQYGQFIDISRGAKIGANAGDPHEETALHMALSVNRKSPTVKQYTNIFKQFAPQIRVDPLSWVGETVAVYVEDSDVWAEFAKAEDKDDFAQENIDRFPVAVYVEVSSGLRLTAFLAGVRAYIDQTAPGMTIWESRTHNEQPYVAVKPSQRAVADEPELEQLGLYYSASGRSLIITLSEELLKGALDREAARSQALAKGETPKRTGPAWLGENMCLQADRRVLQFFEVLYSENYQQRMQTLAWSNLPILNEWKHRYPDHEPVAFHQKFWQQHLVCPGGGKYRWNNKWQTFESTVYGHPGEPKEGPAFPDVIRQIARANFGLTFEENGLRTRVEIKRD